MNTDHYFSILGIPATSSFEDLKSSYRTLAKKYHPDLNRDNPDAEQKFKQISEAYHFLEERYKSGLLPRHTQSASGNGSRSSHKFNDSDIWMSDMLSDIMNHIYGQSHDQMQSEFSDYVRNRAGTEKQTPRKEKGRDISMTLNLDLDKAYIGGEFIINIGTPDDSSAQSKKLRISLPPGMTSNSKLKLAGHGGVGKNGGDNGDLILHISLKKHQKFKLEKGKLKTKVSVPVTTFMAGGKVTFTHLDGRPVTIEMKPTNKTKTSVLCKGIGWPQKNGEHGDLHVELAVGLPSNLTPEQIKQVRNLESMKLKYD